MKVDFNGYGENVATFIAGSGVTPGSIVKVTNNYKVDKATSGDKFIGICIGVRNGYAAVQTSGYVEVGVSGTVTVGKTALAAASATAVSASQSGVTYDVIYVDENKVGLIL